MLLSYYGDKRGSIYILTFPPNSRLYTKIKFVLALGGA